MISGEHTPGLRLESVALYEAPRPRMILIGLISELSILAIVLRELAASIHNQSRDEFG